MKHAEMHAARLVQVLTLGIAAGVEVDTTAPPVEQDCWFAGYGWRMAACS